MNDPTYQFVKGVGWVPETIPTITWEAKGQGGHMYRITLEERRPGPGESFFTFLPEGNIFQHVKPYLKNENWSLAQSYGGRPEQYDNNVDAWFPQSKFCVIKVERI